MKKSLVLIIMLTVLHNSYSYDVDREELEKNKKEIEFVNYSGPHDRIDTRKEIVSIGESLGEMISSAKSADVSGKYRILHLTDPSEPDKLGADLFILEKDAGVDHIRNLRLILAGYLKTAYSYSDEDSALLAEFVTYYNAVFRGDVGYLETRYNNMVMVNIDRENAGIDINYKNWPGKTRMIIPLKNGYTGGEAVPSSSELSEKEVIEDLRKNEDMGIPPRKDMVELRERELDKEREVLAEKEKAIDKKETEVAEARKDVEKKKEALEDNKEKLTEKQYEEEKKGIEVIEAKIAKEETELSEEKSKVQEEAGKIEKEESVIAEERDVIAADTNKLIEAEDAAPDTASVTGGIRGADDVFFVRIVYNGAEKYGEPVLVDPLSGGIIKSSEVRQTGIRGFVNTEEGFYITASQDGSEYNLFFIDKKELNSVYKSDVKVYRDSVVMEDNNLLFAVVDKDGSYRLGKFSSDLSSVLVSDSEVLADTFILPGSTGKDIYFQNSKGEIVSAGIGDLSLNGTENK